MVIRYKFSSLGASGASKGSTHQSRDFQMAIKAINTTVMKIVSSCGSRWALPLLIKKNDLKTACVKDD